jgi:phosphomevalonate kinase
MQLETPEKFAFLHIAHHLAQSDGEIGNREEIRINDYCVEMGIDNIIFDEENYVLENYLDKFKSNKSQRILLLELMMLVHVDDTYNNQEQELMNIISNRFNFQPRLLKFASSVGKAASALREQALLIVNDA